MGKSCTKAHSKEELQEWIQRVKISVKKKKQAQKDGLLSYQDRLLADYRMCSNEVLIVSGGHRVGALWSSTSQESSGVRAWEWSPLLTFLMGMQKGMWHPLPSSLWRQQPESLLRVPGLCCASLGCCCE